MTRSDSFDLLRTWRLYTSMKMRSASSTVWPWRSTSAIRIIDVSLYAGQRDGLLPRPFVNYEHNVNVVRRNWPRGNSHGRFKVSRRGEYGLQNFLCFCRFCRRIGLLRSKPCLCLAVRMLNLNDVRRVD